MSAAGIAIHSSKSAHHDDLDRSDNQPQNNTGEVKQRVLETTRLRPLSVAARAPTPQLDRDRAGDDTVSHDRFPRSAGIRSSDRWEGHR